MSTRKLKIILLMAVLLAHVGICSAKTIDFTLAVDRDKVSLGSTAQLHLNFSGLTDMPVPQLSEIEGFQVRYLGPSTNFSFVNGKTASSITHVYTLIPLKVGTFKIGPFQFDHSGDAYVSNVVTIEVVEGAVQPSASSESGQALEAKDIKERVFLTLEAKKEKVYMNESFPLAIKLYVNGLALRDIQFPELNHEGFSMADFEKPKQYQEVLSGVQYNVIEFDTVLFGVKPGTFQLGPASCKSNLLVKKEDTKRAVSDFENFFGGSFMSELFGRYETYPLDLKSEALILSVASLPEEAKPSDFTGAVGDFKIEVSVKPETVKVGDPVTLGIVVSGEGNFSTVSSPKLISESGFKIYEPQVRQETNHKDFEQVLMPMKEEIKEVPAVVFNFFNPSVGQYQSIVKGPFPIRVSKSENEEVAEIVERSPSFSASLRSEEALGRDIVFIKDFPGRLSPKGSHFYKNPFFGALQVLPLLIYLFFFRLEHCRRRLRTDTRYARLLRAPKKARAGLGRMRDYFNKEDIRYFYDEVYETLRGYLGDKFHLASGGITESIIDEVLIPKGVSADVLDQLRGIFKDCDRMRYAASSLNKNDMARTLKALEDAIDYLQRQKTL